MSDRPPFPGLPRRVTDEIAKLTSNPVLEIVREHELTRSRLLDTFALPSAMSQAMASMEQLRATIDEPAARARAVFNQMFDADALAAATAHQRLHENSALEDEDTHDRVVCRPVRPVQSLDRLRAKSLFHAVRGRVTNGKKLRCEAKPGG